MESTAPASVFVSYSHADQSLARRIAEDLQAAGFRVWIDEGELRIGDSLVEAISEAIGRVDFLVALVSEASVGSDWCRKELSLAMTDEINQEGLVVLPVQIDKTPMPATLNDKFYLAITRDNYEGASLKLVDAIQKRLNPAPTLPQRRKRVLPAESIRQPWGDETPVRIVGIDTDGVTRPSLDGSRGSGLYRVPFLLNVTPDPRWAARFPWHWDHPPQWTTMHRRGISSVMRDRILLDGTTLDEVEDYHLATLKLAVAMTNEWFARMRASERGGRARDERRRALHEESISDISSRLNFD